MTFRVDIGAHAQRDLDRIYRYIQAEFSDQATQWFNQPHVSLASLSRMPYRHAMTREDPLFATCFMDESLMYTE